MQIKIREGIGLVVLAAAIVAIGARPVVAEISTSPNYQMTETQFNAGTSLNSCSGNYCAQATLGSMGTGSTGTAQFGPITPDRPALEVIVEPGTSYLGVLTPEDTATKTMIVKVRSYLSNGYFLQITGSPLKYGSHTLATPGSPTASVAGTEQFGINAVANTAPRELGANPVQVPSSDFAYGEVLASYATPNQYMYQSGDTVARSLTASGQTEYTISMIINVAANTPAGLYTSDFSAVVIPMY